MKKTMLLFLLVAFAIALAGCSSDEDEVISYGSAMTISYGELTGEGSALSSETSAETVVD